MTNVVKVVGLVTVDSVLEDVGVVGGTYGVDDVGVVTVDVVLVLVVDTVVVDVVLLGSESKIHN